MMSLLKVLLLYVLSACTVAYPTGCLHRKTPTKLSLKLNQGNDEADVKDNMGLAMTSRKQFLSTSIALPFLLTPNIVNAGIDPSALKSLPVEGDNSGATSRLRSLSAEEDKAKTDDLVDIPFETLPSGVSYRQYRAGSGDAVVQQGSKVGAEMTIRCKSFATANEPGGLKYYSTSTDTDFNELAFTIGSGQILPGLEEADIFPSSCLLRVKILILVTTHIAKHRISQG